MVEDCDSIQQELEDLQVLVELGSESEDQETLDEIRALLPDVERKVGQMEFARMLSGEHDDAPAIVSINAGAGGTEAQGGSR